MVAKVKKVKATSADNSAIETALIAAGLTEPAATETAPETTAPETTTDSVAVKADSTSQKPQIDLNQVLVTANMALQSDRHADLSQAAALVKSAWQPMLRSQAKAKAKLAEAESSLVKNKASLESFERSKALYLQLKAAHLSGQPCDLVALVNLTDWLKAYNPPDMVASESKIKALRKEVAGYASWWRGPKKLWELLEQKSTEALAREKSLATKLAALEASRAIAAQVNVVDQKEIQALAQAELMALLRK